MNSAKIEILDSLRAFAALSVCLFHFVCTTTGYIQNEFILNLFSVGKYGVQSFFVISGFIIPWSMHAAGYTPRNFFLFFLKRLSRLEPPYIFSIVLALCVLYLRSMSDRTNDHIAVSGQQILLHFGYLIPFFKGYQWLNQVYWTLAIEFQYYLLIAILFIPLIKSTGWLRIVMYAVIAITSLFSPDILIFYWLPVFSLGILLFLFKAGFIASREYYIATLLFTGFCFYYYPPAAVIYSLIPVCAVLLAGQRKVPGLHQLGKFSYSIYLIHPILGASLINVLSHHFSSPLASFMVILCGIVFTVIAAWITYLFIEKPSKKFSASIRYKKT